MIGGFYYERKTGKTAGDARKRERAAHQAEQPHNRIILVRNRAVCCVMKSGPMCTCAMEGFQNECLGL